MPSRIRLALAFLLLVVPTARAQTQLKLDGSLYPGAPTYDIVDLQPAPDYTIGEGVGKRSGANLFHSFEFFDIGPGDSATFTSDPLEPMLANVIARVTGGEPSDIDGKLASTVPGADLYFLNPAGVLFGGASEIDVQGSLYVSTAHRLDFASDGGFLDLLDASDPNLSVEPPAAFGFYAGSPRAEIVFFNPGGPATAKTFQVPDGQTLSAVGGDVRVDNRTRLHAFGGRVQLVATGGAEATVPLDASEFVARGVSGLGEVRVETRSTLDTLPFDTNVNQGTVVLRGGSLVLRDRSLVRGGDRNAGNEAAVDVEFADSVEISERAELRAVSQGPRPSGGVRVSTDSLVVSEDAIIQSRQFSFAPATAHAGEVAIEADRVRVESGGRLISLNQGPGTAAGISVVADTIELDDAEVGASTTGAGTGGGVSLAADRITAVQSVIVADGSTLADAGAAALTASEIELRGGRTQVRTTRPLSAASGDPPTPGAGVTLSAEGGSVRVLDGAAVITQTSGPNPAGDISIVSDTLEILDGGTDAFGDPVGSAVETATVGAGAGGDIHVKVSTLRIGRSAGSEIAGRLATAVAPGASGRGGAIDIIADTVTLEGGGQISTTTEGDGAAGTIDLEVTGDVVIRGDNVVGGEPQPSGVFARSETNADGNDVEITARSIEVTQGGEISTRALGSGRSGNVTLIADELVLVAGAGEQGSVVTARGTDGQGGNVVIAADRVEVLDGGSVDVSTSGSGPGGLLEVIAGDVLVEGLGPVPEGVGGDPLPASLAAQADGTGDAVGVKIDAERSVRVGPGGQITALSKGFGGSPGNIEIEAKDIRVDGGVVTAVSGAGGGGGISLTAVETAKFRHGAEVTVSSFAGGNAGTIVIDAKEVEVLDSAIEADADAFGGNVEIRSAKLTQLLDSTVVALSRGGSSEAGLAGGNVDIQGGAVVLNRSEVVADGLDNADGGNITIEADPYLESTDSRLSASSEFGVDGLIVVSAPIAEVVGELSQLPSNFLDASSQLEDACLARSGSAGSFKVQRARVRPPPDALFTPSDAVAPGCGGP